MIHDEITDVLLRARIPASTKGFIYIHDALEIMDKDSYYFSGKVCALYTKIAKQHGASFSQVERAIRYAFKGAGIRSQWSIIWTPSIPKIPMNSKFCSYGGSRRCSRRRRYHVTICQLAVSKYTMRFLLR